MKSYRKNFTFIIVSAIILVFSACQEKDDDNIWKEQITGFVQKGPFINGTQILMSELNGSMKQIGKIFSSQISNDRGSFEFNSIGLSSCYVEFSATGYYFDEVDGNISGSPLTLFALSDLTDISTVNVNILTHLERQRVEYLVTNNDRSFAEAKSIAQGNILAIFGFQKEDMMSSEELNISSHEDDNAILLATSIILQGKRDVGSLTELLAKISNDIKEDGILSDESILPDLRKSTLTLNLDSVRHNLEVRFQALGVSAIIPDFESYIEDFMSNTSDKPNIVNSEITGLKANSATLTASVNPNSSITTVSFDYGTTADYGNSVTADQSPISGHIAQTMSTNISGLEPATTYHFKVKAENKNGVVFSDDVTFTTKGEAPSVSTLSVSNITSTTAHLNASVNPNWLNTNVTFEYGTTADYGQTISGIPNTISGSTQVNVSCDISVLDPGTTYHFRLRAENALGISFSDDETFETTVHGIVGSVTDFDDNTYSTIGIDKQIWMAENLKTTHYNDGSAIPFIADSLNWGLIAEPAYCWYKDNGDEYKDHYGALYNWYTVNTDKLCPQDWHVPSIEEWNQLINFINSQGENIGVALRAKSGWDEDYNGTDDYNFTALPTGYIEDNGSLLTVYSAEGYVATWWTKSDTGHFFEIDAEEGINQLNYWAFSYGHSVRCVKD